MHANLLKIHANTPQEYIYLYIVEIVYKSIFGIGISGNEKACIYDTKERFN